MANRLRALDGRVALQIFELNSERESLELVNPCASGNVASWLLPRRDAQRLLE